MKKILFILVYFTLVSTAYTVAQNMRTLFIEMPDSIIPLLTATNRADCVDFLDAGMKARVTNRLDGESELLQLTEDYLKIKVSKYSEIQMKLLSCSSGDTVLCIINTVCAEICDSRISFYTKKWKKITSWESFFKKPLLKNFFIDDDSLSKRMLISDMYVVELSLFPSKPILNARYTIPSYLSREDSIFLTKGMHDIEYHWNGKKFTFLNK